MSETADASDIKAAYRKQALRLHPDVSDAPDATQQFSDLSNAYGKARHALTAAGMHAALVSGTSWIPADCARIVDIGCCIWFLPDDADYVTLQMCCQIQSRGRCMMSTGQRACSA